VPPFPGGRQLRLTEGGGGSRFVECPVCRKSFSKHGIRSHVEGCLDGVNNEEGGKQPSPAASPAPSSPAASPTPVGGFTSRIQLTPMSLKAPGFTTLEPIK
jgi:hypothetical protein